MNKKIYEQILRDNGFTEEEADNIQARLQLIGQKARTGEEFSKVIEMTFSKRELILVMVLTNAQLTFAKEQFREDLAQEVKRAVKGITGMDADVEVISIDKLEDLDNLREKLEGKNSKRDNPFRGVFTGKGGDA